MFIALELEFKQLDNDFADTDLAAETSVVDNPQCEDSRIVQTLMWSAKRNSNKMINVPNTKFKAKAAGDGPSARKKS
jgi:hypothetical protein